MTVAGARKNNDIRCPGDRQTCGLDRIYSIGCGRIAEGAQKAPMAANSRPKGWFRGEAGYCNTNR